MNMITYPCLIFDACLVNRSFMLKKVPGDRTTRCCIRYRHAIILHIYYTYSHFNKGSGVGVTKLFFYFPVSSEYSKHWWSTIEYPVHILQIYLQLRCGDSPGRFMGPKWGLCGADKTQVGPMLSPWTLLSGRCKKWLWTGTYTRLSITANF